MFNLVSLEKVALSLRHTQSNWEIPNNPKRAYSVKDKLDRFLTVRVDLLCELSYIDSKFKLQGLARVLRRVREGDSQEDTLQDVSALGTLSRTHKALMVKIGSNFGIVDEADNLVADLE